METDPSDDPDLTEASARYLLAAFRLWAACGRRISTGDVAERLAVRPPSATDMFGTLDDAGYLDHAPNRGVELTPLGEAVARTLSRRQCAVEAFFDDLGTPIGAGRAHAIGYRLPAGAAAKLCAASDHDCRDRCRAGEPGFDGCPKLAEVEVA